MVKIFIETHGCASNQSDSEIMAGLLARAGFEITTSQKNSDLNILNTCNVKLATSHRMIHRIKELTKTGKPLIIAGCMPKTERKNIEKINHEASMIGPDSVQKIVDTVKATLKGKRVVFLKNLRIPKICLPRISKNPVVSIQQIATGCKGNCSYCIVKLARGELFSYPMDLILKDIEDGIKIGYKEFWICSQDNACYGFDIGTTLPELLNRITELEGKFFVRVGMMNPLYTIKILDELIECYKNEKIFKFLHLPLESGSNKVLKIMRRGYKVKDFVYCVKKFRKAVKDLTLATDIIVGHPGEEEKDFMKTIKIIKKVKPDVVNLSKFGARPGTFSSKLEQVDSKVINERSKILHSLIRRVSLERNRRWLNWEGEIIIDETFEDFSEGRNFAYKPIVVKEKIVLGKFLNVKIVEVKENFLVGEVR